MRLYENGLEVGRQSKGGLLDVDPSVGVAIGNQPSGAGPRPFEGLIDDVRVYERTLDAAELAKLIALPAPALRRP